MNGSEINLHLFCGDIASICRQPWSWGNYSYATDGRILIRVDRRAGVLDGDFENTIDLIEKLITPVDNPWHECPPSPGYEIKPCRWCADLDDRRKSLCEECGGSREEIVWPSVKVEGRALIDGKYIDLISRLHNPMLQINATEKNPYPPVVFIFKGGCGAVMPMIEDN